MVNYLSLIFWAQLWIPPEWESSNMGTLMLYDGRSTDIHVNFLVKNIFYKRFKRVPHLSFEISNMVPSQVGGGGGGVLSIVFVK